MNLSDLFPLEALDRRIADGYVRSAIHPTSDRRIYNYTEKAQYEQVWDRVTTNCRGLIANSAGAIVARPFPKFFSVGDPNCPQVDLDARAVVTEKMDGSLGVLYFDDRLSRYAVASRGSFTSDQAVHATRTLGRYGWEPTRPYVTVLFEIIYPGNRIVVDYEDLDDLVLLDAYETDTGRQVDVGWPGPTVETHEFGTLAEALAQADRPNREGFVVWFPDTGTRVKVKHQEYLRLHKIVFGLTAVKLWEIAAVLDLRDARQANTARKIGGLLHIDANDVQAILDAYPHTPTWREDLLDNVPDEFHRWVFDLTDRLYSDVGDWAVETVVSFSLSGAANCPERRDAATIILKNPLRSSAWFALLDGKPILHMAWLAVRPEHATWTTDPETG